MEKYPLQEEFNDYVYRSREGTIGKVGGVAIAGYLAGQRKLRWWQKLAAFLKRLFKLR